MPETIALSEAAVALIRDYRGGIAVTDSNREACRELEAAGLTILSRPFTGPRVYRLTQVGWKFTDVLARMDAKGARQNKLTNFRVVVLMRACKTQASFSGLERSIVRSSH